jgi:hypothetical protein
MDEALRQFKDKIKAATGREALPREISAFTEQVAVASAHHQSGAMQFGLCDFQTLSGRALTIEVQLR